VFVVVAFMLGMAVAVVDVVHVVAVSDSLMSAVRAAVLVFRWSVFRWVVVFVVVAFMFGVAVAVVDVVHVVAVLDGDVVAVGAAVLVFGEGVFGLDFLGHDSSFADAGRGCS
jgi:hypothetical protein